MVGIISNSAALFAQRNLETASVQSELSIARLSSGNAIIRASDDVSGLAIGTTLATTLSTLKSVLTSTSQAGSLLSIADGGLQNISDILARQKSLATQANTGTLSDNERAFLNQEFQSLVSEIDRIVTNTTFNGINLLDGSISGAATVQLADTVNADYGQDGTVGTTVDGLDGTAIVFTNAQNEPGLQGTIGTITGTFFDGGTGLDVAALTTTVGGTVYNATLQSAATAGDFGAQTITFVSVDSTAQFEVDLNATADATDQTELDALLVNVNADLAAVTIVQTRDLSSTSTTAVAGTVLDSITAAAGTVTLTSFNFTTTATDATLGDIGSFTGVAGSGAANSLSVVINGVTYTDTDVGAGSVLTTADTITLLGQDAVGNATGESLVINLAGITGTINLVNQDEVDALTTALDTFFQIGGTGSGGLNFQVGTVSTDSISLTLASAATTSIYKDAAGTAQVLSIGTAAGAQTATTVLDIAINSVTSRRATIGALQSRFDFAAANVTSSIQNTEAARSDFLDVDIANESTEFATAQVRLQASISVLAQANQIPQNLLKLIG